MCTVYISQSIWWLFLLRSYKKEHTAVHVFSICFVFSFQFFFQLLYSHVHLLCYWFFGILLKNVVFCRHNAHIGGTTVVIDYMYMYAWNSAGRIYPGSLHKCIPANSHALCLGKVGRYINVAFMWISITIINKILITNLNS